MLSQSNFETTVRETPASSSSIPSTTSPTATTATTNTECNTNPNQEEKPHQSISDTSEEDKNERPPENVISSTSNQPPIQQLAPIAPDLASLPPASSDVSHNWPGAAVRILFKDEHDHQLQQQQVDQNDSVSLVTPVNRSSSSIVSANRRLIERQIEALQAADSRRWNFNFRECRPLAQAGHRYVHCMGNNSISSTPRTCRMPLNDQNQSQDTRFDNNNNDQSAGSRPGEYQTRNKEHHHHRKQEDG